VGVIPPGSIVREVIKLRELVLPGKCLFLSSTRAIARAREALAVEFWLNPELDVALSENFHHVRVNLFFTEVLLVSDRSMGGEGCCVMRPQDIFNDVREAHLIWEVFAITFEQTIRISVQSQFLRPVILIEFLPVAVVEEVEVELIDQLKSVILRPAEICIISPKGDNELPPHAGEFAPSGSDFPIEF